MAAKRRTRSGGERHTRLTYFLTGTAAWLSLTPAERAVYLEVARVYDGRNNGFLGLSVRRAGERCNINKDTAARALQTLVERGFLELATPGGFSLKLRHAAEYRLTEYACDKTHAAATKAYQRWRPSPPEERRTRSPSKGQEVRFGGTERTLRVVG